ncbi:MAG: sulfite reductase flavoprotein subunit alpha [Hyphomicrobiaceae bacterium]
MTSLAIIPNSAPFSAAEISALNTVVGRSSPEQRAWLSGYLAGLGAAAAQPQPATITPPRERVPLTILYASESGNSEGLAFAARKSAAKLGFDARVLDMADTDPAALVKVRNLLVYAATWGEGDPPQRAADFYGALMAPDAPRLDGVGFAVLALGDSAYVNFCETGRRIDERLAELGATRAADRLELDLDFAKPAAQWTATTLEALVPADDKPAATVVHVDFHHATESAASDSPAFSPEAPLEAEITGLVNLSGTGSTRETWAVELATDQPGFAYLPGDAIGVVAENDPATVASLIDAAGAAPDAALTHDLTHVLDITTLSRSLAERYAKLTGRVDVGALAGDPRAFQAFAADRQIVDLFARYPARLDGAQLKGLLRPLPPRLYSVASSPAAHAGETHLLVGAVRWQSHGLNRKGVASTYLADRRKPGQALKIYVKPNRHFRLPADPHRPIIMIGAGTGIAPYRGFVAEREAVGATGPNWLVFGERNFTHDFLYQLEWQDWLANGVLSRLDVAFSRDQPEKVYVQHRLWQHRADIRGWLADGAHIYVCGDETGMARDVDETLVRILAEPPGGDAQAGRAALKTLAKDGRYQRDVY